MCLCILVYHVHTGISCTYWYIMCILVYHVHTGISCAYWYIMYILIYHVHTGISCTYWYIMYILIYHVHTGISCTYWYIMYILVYHVHTGISCTYLYIMYILVYLCVFTSCIFFNSFVSSCALTWIFPKEKWLFQHNLKFYKKPYIEFWLLSVMHIMKSYRLLKCTEMKWARIKNKTKRRGGYHRPTNEITHPANDIHCTNKTRNYKLKNELHCICPLFLHVQLIFLFKLNAVSPIGSTLDQEKTVDIYGTPVWHISFNICNDKDSHSAKESGKEVGARKNVK